MAPIITAFETSPDRGRGLARDMRVRWALEEVGQPYEVRLLSFAALKQPAHRAKNPFGQIPTYEDGALTLFESGAIVLHIAETNPGLLPPDPHTRARAIAWMFAALDTVEPPIMERSLATILERDRPWFAERQTVLDTRIHTRLTDLATALGPADWLTGPFTAADLLMVTALRRLTPSGLLADHETLTAYITRAESRPAFQRAFTAQRAAFEATNP